VVHRHTILSFEKEERKKWILFLFQEEKRVDEM